MSEIEIKVPVFAESISEGTIVTWLKKEGDTIDEEEVVVEIETDKVVFEVPAPKAGKLTSIILFEGDTVLSEQTIAKMQEGDFAKTSDTSAQTQEVIQSPDSTKTQAKTSPAVRDALNQNDLDKTDVKATGKNNRILMSDVQNATQNQTKPSNIQLDLNDRIQKRVPMSRIREKIAQRLLYASQSTAMLTTFNEIDMQPVMETRAKYQQEFQETHGIKLGFMSFFVKATLEALKRYPAVNASIDGNDIVYHGFFDIGIAVSTQRGLMVPIIRNVENLSLSDIEKAIVDFGSKAQNGKIDISELQGGTFSITNGGIFGSMLSTPILNPPQSAILGMHAIQKRAVVVNDEVVIRPMMYVALSYDHRIIDGKEAVSFLKCIKEFVEDPFSRIVLEV